MYLVGRMLCCVKSTISGLRDGSDDNVPPDTASDPGRESCRAPLVPVAGLLDPPDPLPCSPLPRSTLSEPLAACPSAQVTALLVLLGEVPLAPPRPSSSPPSSTATGLPLPLPSCLSHPMSSCRATWHSWSPSAAPKPPRCPPCAPASSATRLTPVCTWGVPSRASTSSPSTNTILSPVPGTHAGPSSPVACLTPTTAGGEPTCPEADTSAASPRSGPGPASGVLGPPVAALVPGVSPSVAPSVTPLPPGLCPDPYPAPPPPFSDPLALAVDAPELPTSLRISTVPDAMYATHVPSVPSFCGCKATAPRWSEHLKTIVGSSNDHPYHAMHISTRC